MSEESRREDPLKQPTVTTQQGQDEDMVRRGGRAAVDIDSPTIMRKEQNKADELPKHADPGKPSTN
jgi:hypothetical protein